MNQCGHGLFCTGGTEYRGKGRSSGQRCAAAVFACMWGIRITMAAFLAPRIGLTGVWIAMCAELCIRGILFLIRLFREKWLEV